VNWPSKVKTTATPSFPTSSRRDRLLANVACDELVWPLKHSPPAHSHVRKRPPDDFRLPRWLKPRRNRECSLPTYGLTTSPAIRLDLSTRQAVMSVVPKPIPKPPFFRWENPEEAVQLETRRLEVLDQIQQCKSANDYKGPPLRELQKKYNRLVDKLDKLERGDELLNRLKTIEFENWQRIVQMVPLVMFDTDAVPGTRPNPIDDVLSLCLVHKEWRKWIYLNPGMWNHLIFDHHFASGSDWAKLEIALKLSGDLPLHMRSILWIHQWDVFYKILGRVADRLETLDLDMGWTYARDSGYTHDYLVEFVEEMPILPSLRELVCPKTNGWPVIFNQLASKAPNLRYIKGIELSLDVFQPEYIHSKPISSEHFLLEVRRYLYRQNKTRPEERFHSANGERAGSLITDLPLNRTQTLALKRKDWPLIDMIPGRLVGLRSLTIDFLMTWQEVHKILRCLHEMPTLRAFAMELSFKTNEVVWSDCKPCNLTSLYIQVDHPLGDQITHLKEVGEARVEQLFEAMAKFMPHINELKFKRLGAWTPRALWDLIPKLKYLHVFSLLGAELSAVEDGQGWPR
ncbi:6136_t:CDS:2, partial [Acaulospora colombiana]